jgi:hypothetical protein
MRCHFENALLFSLLCMTVAPAPLAQERSSQEPSAQKNDAGSKSLRPVNHETSGRTQKPIAPPLLTRDDGLAILSVALDFRHHPADSTSDCSHFVHGLYERAGFPYEYAGSSDLYDGVEEFRRVTNPQPGDLAVWRGHAGIVVNPAQHSFFSALSSGHGVDSYYSPYWKQRGQPRFFRYVKRYGKPALGGVLSASARTASLKPAALADTGTHEARVEDIAPGRPVESAGGVHSTLVEADLPPDSPRIVIINSPRPKPDQVAGAFLALNKDWAESLGNRDLFHLDHALIVFDHFEVKKVHIAGDQGWAEVQFEQPISLTGNKAEAHKRTERQRWSLRRRNNASWELRPATDTIRLPSSIAVRMLAHELATLTEDNPSATGKTENKAELARVLDMLLSK